MEIKRWIGNGQVDMWDGSSMKLLTDEAIFTVSGTAGDPWIEILDQNERVALQFASISNGGGQSPHTFYALCRLLHGFLRPENLTAPSFVAPRQDWNVWRQCDMAGYVFGMTMKQGGAVTLTAVIENNSWDRRPPARAEFVIHTGDLPPELVEHFVTVAYAMMLDNEGHRFAGRWPSERSIRTSEAMMVRPAAG